MMCKSWIVDWTGLARLRRYTVGCSNYNGIYSYDYAPTYFKLHELLEIKVMWISHASTMHVTGKLAIHSISGIEEYSYI